MIEAKPAPPMVLVAGATGYLGRHVVRALHEAGYRVRALARDPARLGDVRPLCDEVFVGEATQPDTLKGLCDGASFAFSSLGIRHLRRRPTFWDVDMQANLNVLARARAAGVRHFVFVSVLHGDELRARMPIAEARERVADALRASGMTWTVLRPTGFFNDMAEFFAMARRGRVYLLGDGRTRLNPIHGADTAREVVRAIEDPALHDKAVPLGGPDVLSLREIGQLAFRALDRPARFGHVPPGVVRAAAALARPVNENAAAFLKMFALMGELDGVAPSVGTHHLKDFFAELAASAAGAA